MQNPVTLNNTSKNPSTAQQVLLSLQQDKTDLNALQQNLLAERQALEKRQHQQLDFYNQQKAELTSTLDKRYSDRLQLLAKNGNSINGENWRKLLDALQAESRLPLSSLWNEVETQLKECQKLLLINEKIVANLQQNVEQLLGALRGASNTSQTYSAKGKAQVFADNQTITSA